ncbi:MAG TPA: hypothetical protein ENN30_00545 [Candidatus Woesearchaeota archaeon]|nr:hypothetical protein [Candidatus Woesearchaeota archaeon]
MKCVIVGNLASRTEILGKKKESSRIGGASYYAGITSARLGAETTIITKLSEKFNSKWIKELEKEKIKLIKQPAWTDTEYQVSYNAAGDKKVKIISDAGNIVNVPELNPDVVVISSNINKVSSKVLKKLKTPENILALDAQSFINYTDPKNKELTKVPWLEKEEFLKSVDILKLNAKELYYLTGKKTLNSALDLLKLGPKIVTLTLAKQGAYIFYDRRYIKVPIYETKMVHKGGVGDVYITAFALRYKETEDITDAAYFAAAAASFAVEKHGAAGIEKLNKVEKRYKTLREIFLA